MECLASSGSCSADGIQKAIDAHVIAPWVTATVSGSGSQITVGNNSAPSFKNKAVISSFQYGQSNGTGCTLDIIDEEGGAFDKFFKKLNSDLATAEQKYVLEIQWGWVGSSCNSQSKDLPKSKKHYFLITQVGIHIESNIRFSLEGTDLMQAGFISRLNKTYGEKGKEIPLKDAIKQACKDYAPSITQVDFFRKTEGGQPKTWEFKDNPHGVWHCHNRTLMSIIHDWISRYVTDEDKGIQLAWDDTKPNSNLILWEFDESPKGKPKKTYIVNGGQCSPVVEFTTNIKWNFAVAAAVGGNADGKVTAGNTVAADHSGKNGPKDKQIGTDSTKPVDTNAIGNFGKVSSQKGTENDIKNTRANLTYESIEGELRIQGDPTLDDPIENKFFKIGLVVINPINLTGANCPEWGMGLAQSTCNETLSSKEWEVRGVVHDIRLGSYTTTLKIFIPTPRNNSGGDTTIPK